MGLTRRQMLLGSPLNRKRKLKRKLGKRLMRCIFQLEKFWMMDSFTQRLVSYTSRMARKLAVSTVTSSDLSVTHLIFDYELNQFIYLRSKYVAKAHKMPN